MMKNMTVAEKYSQPEVVNCWQNLSRQGLQQAEQEMVTRYLPPEGRLLDVGCGAGRAVLALDKAGYRVTGIDLSLPMLLAGRSLSAKARLAGANVVALPFADHTFQAALMFFGALQHIPGKDNRRRALAEIHRLVKPGGHLVLGLDNLAPGLMCYLYWAGEKIFGRAKPASGPATAADRTLWSRESRRVHPLVWHMRGVARTLRWRAWPALVDLRRRLSPRPGRAGPGDVQVAQFSLHTTPGKVYYHIYRPDELVNDAAAAGWQLLGHHCGTELSQGRVYPASIRRQDKQQFYAFMRE